MPVLKDEQALLITFIPAIPAVYLYYEAMAEQSDQN